MPFTFFDLISILGALGIFIFGMKIMSEGIQEIAGDRLRSLLNAMTSNRFGGILTGFVSTSVIQSSSATTVMVVSFVNAGLLTLRQSIGVIMGANIGTTVTGIIIATFALSKFSISAYALPVFGIAFPIYLLGNGKLKNWGEFLIGFALLFMGLGLLKSSVPEISAEHLQGIENLTHFGIFSVLLFILIGTAITIILQSSSAAMALTLVMCDLGYIPFDIAAAIVLGENIGTTITANLAAIIGNVFAKRAARAHFIFNVFGVLWMIPVFYLFTNAIAGYMVNNLSMISPFEDPSNIKWALTTFHSSFNIINTILLVWFVGFIEKAVVKITPAKSEEDEVLRLKYITKGVFTSGEISIAEAKEEIKYFGKLIQKMTKLLSQLAGETKQSKREKLLEKISKHETQTDELEEDVGQYLVRAAKTKLSLETSVELKGLFDILTHLERIGDIILNISKNYLRLNKKSIKLNKEQIENLNNMAGLVKSALDTMNENLNSDRMKVSIAEALLKEEEINNYRKKLRKQLMSKIDEPGFDVPAGIIYRDLFYGYENLGDHILNVTEAMMGEKLDLD